MLISSKEFLKHIRDEIRFVIENTEQLSFKEFVSDEILKRAVVRSLEIIGEAVKNVNSDIIDENPAVEWSAMAKTRDKLIHHYFGVDYEIVWNIIEDKLPDLLVRIEEILDQNNLP